MKNQEAEAAAVRKAAWGVESEAGDGEDPMGDSLHVGKSEIHNHNYPEQKKASVSPLLAGLLGASLLGTGGLGAVGLMSLLSDGKKEEVFDPSDYDLILAPPVEATNGVKTVQPGQN